MKKKELSLFLLTISLTSLMAFTLVGCDDTVEGARKDANELGTKAEKVAEESEEAIKETTEDVSAASLTPIIKSALMANPLLNEEGNVIDVDSADMTVTIKGHVMTAEQKEMATDIAAKILEEKESDFELVNELEVTGK